MGKSSTIDGFFKRKNPTNLDADGPSPTSNVETPIAENHPTKLQRTEINNDGDIGSLEHDPGLRHQIWEYDVNQRNEIQ